MTLLLDHVFVITKPGAPEAEKLTAIGLVEGSSNNHPGQGTSNRRFFLEKLTIELLFVSDQQEALTGAGRNLGILARSQDETASPFGLVARLPAVNAKPAFPHWQYFPDYFAGDLCFYVGENSDQFAEPLCICMPPALPNPAFAPVKEVNAGWKFSALTIWTPSRESTATLRQFETIENVDIRTGPRHKMKITFNDGAAGRSEDLCPDLPLVLTW